MARDLSANARKVMGPENTSLTKKAKIQCLITLKSLKRNRGLLNG